jgi:WD40 repeat protein
VGQHGFVTLEAGPHAAVTQRWSLTGRPDRAPLALLHHSVNANIDALFLGPEGRLAGVIVVGPNGKAPVQIWNVQQRRLIATVPPSIPPLGGEPTFSPDGRTLAMAKLMNPGDPGASFTLVDARTGRTKDLGTTTCTGGWDGYAFDRSSTLVAAGSFCGEAYVWNAGTGRRVGRPIALGGELAAIAFSPDRRRIAVASWNSTVKVADVATGRVIGTLTGHTGGVAMVAYSPDGRYLASASLDHTVRIWDARTLALLRVITHPDRVLGVEFTSDSRDIVTFDAASTVRVWDACTACEEPKSLLALARTRITRALTAQERKTFGVS